MAFSTEKCLDVTLAVTIAALNSNSIERNDTDQTIGEAVSKFMCNVYTTVKNIEERSK